MVKKPDVEMKEPKDPIKLEDSDYIFFGLLTRIAIAIENMRLVK